MHLKGYYTTLSLLASIAMFTACTLEDPEPSTFNFPINLQAEKNYSLVTLNWTSVKVTEFKEYIILQSSEQIPASPTPTVSSQVTVFTRIDDADITTITATDIIFTPRVCYKIYAAVGDRFLQSANVCIDQDFTILEGIYDQVGHAPGIDEVAMFDRQNLNLSVYDYKEQRIEDMVSEFSLSFPMLELSAWAGKTDLYAYDQSFARIFKYRFPDLVRTHTKLFNGVLFAVKAHEQFLFVSVDEFGETIKVLNRDNLAEIDGEDGLSGPRNLAVFPGDPDILIDVNDGSIFRYSISSSGHLTFIDSKPSGILQPLNQNFTANGSQLFIGGRRGEIIDREGNVVGALVNNLNEVVTLTRFSVDEKKVVYIVSDVTTKMKVADITDPQNIQVINSFDLPSATFSGLIVDEDFITLIGVSFDFGQAQSFALKYPMP